ncbi:MAG: hypothetical protein ACQEP6_00875 [Patescibacteria group bacterium]
MSLAANFKVLKDEHGEIVGFSLFANGEKRAASFCNSFRRHLVMGVGDIEIDGGRIKFFYPNIPNSEKCEHKLHPKEGEAIKEILKKGESGFLMKENTDSPGFSVVKT